MIESVKGKHKKTCPVCQEIFYGRLNKVYCTIVPCKASLNNGKASIKNKPLKKEYDLLKSTRGLLGVMYKRHGRKQFPMHELRTLRFKNNTPFEEISIDGDNKQWQRVCEFAFYYDAKLDAVQIINLDDGDDENDNDNDNENENKDEV